MQFWLVDAKIRASDKNLPVQDPANKQYFTPDAKMAPVFGTEKIRAFGMAKYLTGHLTPIKELGFMKQEKKEPGFEKQEPGFEKQEPEFVKQEPGFVKQEPVEMNVPLYLDPRSNSRNEVIENVMAGLPMGKVVSFSFNDAFSKFLHKN